MIPGISETRPVPLTLCLQMLLESGFSLFGWVFFGFGFIIALAVVSRCEVLVNWQFSEPLSSTTGVVERTRDTRSNENGQQIYAIHYAFTPPGGALRLHGTAYALGDQPARGKQVTVDIAPIIRNIRAFRACGRRHYPRQFYLCCFSRRSAWR